MLRFRFNDPSFERITVFVHTGGFTLTRRLPGVKAQRLKPIRDDIANIRANRLTAT